MNLTKANEWVLAAEHKSALKNENYEMCLAIQKEIDNRIANGTINHSLMQGFRNYDSVINDFVGHPKYTGLNDLFKNYNPNQQQTDK